MSAKYYVETDELTTYGDSSARCFHHEHPFDCLEDAQKWAVANPGEDIITIYYCRDNVIVPITIGWDLIEEEV